MENQFRNVGDPYDNSLETQTPRVLDRRDASQLRRLRSWSDDLEVALDDQSIMSKMEHTKTMRKPVTFQGLVGAFALSNVFFVPLALWILGVRLPVVVPQVPPPPSIAQIQAISELAITRVHISDSIEGENRHYVGRWSLHGEVLLGVELSTVRYVKLDEKAKRATIQLPQPHIIITKVDHEHSQEIAMQSKVWIPTSSSAVLREEIWLQADRKMQRLAQEVGYRESAKVQAERVMASLFDGFGWKVDFEWR